MVGEAPVGDPELDDPATTIERHELIRVHRPLRVVYAEWYRLLAAALPPGQEPVLELGSGGGFLSDLVPGLLRSEVCPYPWVDFALDAQALPFRAATLRGIVMTNVLHHVPQPARLFREAARCVRPGGVLAMIEPWYTGWSGFVYRRFHHEPFEPQAREWVAPPGGPLTGANGALPWIVFQRDRERFERDHPEWEIRRVEPLMPLSYLLTGGLSGRFPVPAVAVSACIRLERLLGRLARRQALFASIELVRR